MYLRVPNMFRENRLENILSIILRGGVCSLSYSLPVPRGDS